MPDSDEPKLAQIPPYPVCGSRGVVQSLAPQGASASDRCFSAAASAATNVPTSLFTSRPPTDTNRRSRLRNRIIRAAPRAAPWLWSGMRRTGDLIFPVQQIAAGDGPQVEFGRRFEELGGGGDAPGGVADGPDAQAVEAGLQLGAEDEGGVGFVVVRVGHEDRALTEALILEPGVQQAGRRRVVGAGKMRRQVGRDLVAASFLGAQPALDLGTDCAGVAHAARVDIGEGDRPAGIDEAADAVGWDGGKEVVVVGCRPDDGNRSGLV